MTSSIPIAEITAIERTRRSILTSVVFDRSVLGPWAPAGLYADPRESEEVLPLHRVVHRDEQRYRFETFGFDGPLPSVGLSLAWRGWWVTDAMDCVLDTSISWQHLKYPDDGSHAHCVFTWATIKSSGPETSGWYARTMGWVTESAYCDYVRDDVYGLREFAALNRWIPPARRGGDDA